MINEKIRSQSLTSTLQIDAYNQRCARHKIKSQDFQKKKYTRISLHSLYLMI